MKFDNAAVVEATTYDMLLDSYEAGKNRMRINQLANGEPPYTPEEQEENNIGTNVNDLTLTNVLHNARRQFHNAFLAVDPLFTVNLDIKPIYKKRDWAQSITQKINKRIKLSQGYFETRRSIFANTCSHGIGPSMYDTRGMWCPYPLGVEDVLMPSDTMLMMDNLEHFAVYREYSPGRLYDMTHGPNVDKGWQMDVVDAAIKWADKAERGTNPDNWPNLWFPEKYAERLRNGIMSTSVVPKIGFFDFYFYSDEGKTSGWRRRIILDAWGSSGGQFQPDTSKRMFEVEKGRERFLFDSGERVYADKLNQIINFQFADVSAVAPFRYHSVRSLGFLLYAVCHLQNRLSCKFNDAVFESLLQYFRVNNPADVDRLTHINLVDKGLLPEGLQFVGQQERWKVDEGLISRAMEKNRQTISDNSLSFTQDFDFEKENASETATRTMARINSTAALVGAMLNQAYSYQFFQYMEICRRFCMKDSRDADVRAFRNDCLKEMPKEALDVNRWDVQPTKVLGAGNQQMQVAMADKIMAVYEKLEPSSQTKAKRIYLSAVTQDYVLANDLVPEAPEVSNSVHDAELSFGSLMQGVKLTPRPGLNPVEIAETILRLMAEKIAEINQSGGVGKPEDVIGLMNAEQYCTAFLQQLAQDKNQKSLVKMLKDELGKLANMIKAFGQRHQEQQQKQQQNGNQLDPETQAKIQAILMQAKVKSENAKQSHAERTAQRRLTFEQKVKQDQIKNRLAIQKDLAEHAANLTKTGMETIQNLKLNRMKAFNDDES